MPRPVMRRHPAPEPDPQVESDAPTTDNTKDEIVEWLEGRDVEVPSRATKAELLELIP